MSAFFDLRKALVGVSASRDKIDQLHQAIRFRDEARIKREQALYEAEANEVTMRHQEAKIERLTQELELDATAGLLTRRERSMVPSLAVADKMARLAPGTPPPAPPQPRFRSGGLVPKTEAQREGLSDSQYSALGAS